VVSGIVNILGFYSWATPIQESQGSDSKHGVNSEVFDIATLSINIKSSKESKAAAAWGWLLICLVPIVRQEWN